MNSSFANVMTRALLASRQCYFSASPLRHSMRVFSSSPGFYLKDKGQAREIEKSFLRPNRNSPERPDDSSFHILSDIIKSKKISPSNPVPESESLSYLVGDLVSDLIPNPYADISASHHLHVYSHRHNTHITLTRPNGEPLLSLSCGNLGFRKAARGGYDAAYQLTAYTFGKIHEKGLLMGVYQLDLIFRDFGPGRDAFIKVLLGNEGAAIRGLIKRITDATRIKFGGTRSRRKRRLG